MNEESIDLSSLWEIISKKIPLIIMVTVLITMISGIITFFLIEPEYKSTVAVFISDQKTGNSELENINDLNMYQKLVDTYAEIAKSRTVANDIIETLDLDLTVSELQGMISTSPRGNTQFLNLMVTSPDRESAYQITNQLAISLKDVSMSLRGIDIVQILDAANVPAGPSSPNLRLNLAIGFVLGLMVSIFGVFLLEFMDKTVKDEDFIKDELKLPFLGALPDFKSYS